MKKNFAALLVGLFCLAHAGSAFAAPEFWSVSLKSVVVNNSGQLSFLSSNWTGPSVSGDTTPCNTGVAVGSDQTIFFHTDDTGKTLSDPMKDRMLQVALSAWLSGHRLRVFVDKGADGNCYARMYSIIN